jgi:5-methylcytosine-specific restriction endonuclease McrA
MKRIRKTIDRNCDWCQKQYLAKTHRLRSGKGLYCSYECGIKARSFAQNKDKIPNVTCAYCGIEIYRNPTKLKKSKSKLYFCCREHKSIAQRIGGIKEIHPPHYSDSLKSYRDKAFRFLDNKCNRCNYDECPAILQVHHKDKNRNNNELNNLEILCPNCHALHHYLDGSWRWREKHESKSSDYLY